MTINKNFYENLDEAVFRLGGTVVGYDGAPYYCFEVQDRGREFFDLKCKAMPFNESTKFTYLSISDPLFNRFQPIKLGWLNTLEDVNAYGRHAHHLSRIPVRGRRQGLCSEALYINPVVGSRVLSFNHTIKMHGFVETVIGVYPHCDEVLDIMGKDTSIGISREFLIHRDPEGFYWLWKEQTKVGLFFRGGLYIYEAYSYLKEAILQEPNLPDSLEIGV